MKKLLVIGSLILSLITTAKAASVTLAWDANCSTNIVGYSVFYGYTNGVTPYTNITQAFVDDCGTLRPTSTNIYRGAYTNTNSVTGVSTTSMTLTNLTVGNTYAFVLVSVGSVPPSTNILQSDFSSEVIYTIPTGTNIYVPPAITGFGIRSVGP